MITTPEASRILDIATGYMAAKQLFEASRIGLFAAIDGGAQTVDEIAAITAVTPRMVRILADAMTAEGLLQRADGLYALRPDAAAYLVGADSALDLGPFLAFLSEISYPHWLQFGTTVDTTEPGDLQMDDARWEVFMAGVMTYNRLHGQEFGRHIDLGGATRALDLGGLSPAFAIAAMQQHPTLHTTFVYAPGYDDGISVALDEAGLADRAIIAAAETPTAQPEGQFDAVFVNHVLHRFSAEENRAILANVRAAATDGAVLTLVDFFLDDDPETRPLDTRHAAEYLVIDGTVVYPESEVHAWLAETGWEVREKISLPGSPRVLIATAV